MSFPLASSFFNVISASTLVSSNSVSSIFRTGSEKFTVITTSFFTAIAPSPGTMVTDGGATSSVEKVIQVSAIALLLESST